MRVLYCITIMALAVVGGVLAWRTAAARCNFTVFTGSCARWQTCFPVEMWTEHNCYTGINACCYCETEVMRCSDGTRAYRDRRWIIESAICNPASGKCISVAPPDPPEG